ncbi:MAG: gamma-glutamyl-gamma-aminobutyrate hydrolase family protein, partial [Saprospiraceae bacterium]
NLKDASSTEVNPNTPHPVIDLMAEQKVIVAKGGTMRLGAYQCNLKDKSLVKKAYKTDHIVERHRHRYEFNNAYAELIEKNGMIATGLNSEQNLIEIIELKNHPWFVGVQFHPELKSTVECPHPLFVGFIKACIQHKASN